MDVMRQGLCLGVGLLLGWVGMFVPVATEASVAMPHYQAADTFIFSGRRVEQVVDVAGDVVEFRSRSGRRYQQHRNFIVPVLSAQAAARQSQVKILGKPEALWPLAVGKRNRFRSLKTVQDTKTGSTRRSVDLWSCEVAAQQSLIVTAGTFETYRVVCDRFSEGSMRLQKRYVWHYAPVVGHYVKRERISYIDGSRRSYELLATLHGRDANPARIKALLKQAQPR